jgi:hypothetical protein
MCSKCEGTITQSIRSGSVNLPRPRLLTEHRMTHKGQIGTRQSERQLGMNETSESILFVVPCEELIGGDGLDEFHRRPKS